VDHGHQWITNNVDHCHQWIYAFPGAIDNQSVGTGHQIPNPSIAPSIGEASVALNASLYGGSGGQLDRVGESDRDSASNRAIAGASLNGSMSGSTYATVVGMQTK